MKKLISFGFAIATALAFTACDSYLDVNDDPNNPTEPKLSPSEIFPGAEAAYFNSMGGTYNYYTGFLTEQYATISGVQQWGKFGRNEFVDSDTDSGYRNFLAGMILNATTVMTKAEASEDWGTYLAGQVLRFIGFQTLVDCYGESPYTEAMDLNITAPHWDAGADVYAAILAELDEALAKPINPSGTMCTNLLLANKTAGEWIKLAKSLKFRALMRISNVQNVQSQLASLIAEDNFITEDAAWKGFWAAQAEKGNPLWLQWRGTGNSIPNLNLNVALQRVYEAPGEVDAREFRYWNAANDGTYIGWVSGKDAGGEVGAAYNGKGNASWLNMAYDDPIYLITVAEIEFFKAEYYARYGSAADAKAHYEAAVRASFSKTAGLDEALADNVLSYWSYDQNNWAKCIGIQKWAHLACVNPFESWCEIRRLKYPTYGGVNGEQIFDGTKNGTVNATVLTPGDLYNPWDNRIQANTMMQRWPYPQASYQNNPNTPKEFKGFTTPVFWAE